ncbi:putative RNA polymerase II subunit B1 CTD phosphatase rpap2 isoform X1 [Chiloscyllium plagiosum]|uniref:putative RNA polymerase II subunit B1 CTD phosphatase rpap2 isoform X1 n=1 Tax=Chiloscyllium plagiosum TaxID=36176 RepID=UPI001CB843AB|nr:putative RNA polymerase II subunit B1 CTD phosphatase rpap2 isoform X1 [Chiloscyllium plagiosum]
MASEWRGSPVGESSRSRRRERSSAATANSKAGVSDVDGALKRKAALQEALRKKRECEAKALRVVEQLLEINVTEEFLLDCVHFITAVHYKDIVEERSIIEQCGYPICQNKLENVPKQQYRISTHTNRVYDITERKCFCSNFCYKASKYLEAQIPKNPLWSRDQERSSVCRLLKEQRGSAGEEVQLQSSSIHASHIDASPFLEDQDVSTSSSESNSSGDSDQEFVSNIIMGEKCSLKASAQKQLKKQQPDMIIKSKKMIPVSKHSEMDHKVDNVLQELKKCHVKNAETLSSRSSQSGKSEQLIFTPEEKCSLISEKNLSLTTLKANKNFTTQGLSKKGAASLKMLIAKSKQLSHSTSGVGISGKSNVLELLRQTLIEWRTEETSRFLYGSNSKCAKQPPKWPSPTSCVTAQEELDEDDLDSLEVVEIANPNENAGDNDLTKGEQVGRSETTAKPLPNFEQLRQESDFLHFKVREFYKGQYVLPGDSEHCCDENHQSVNYVPGSKEEDPVLPLLDFAAQHQIRKQIVLDRLHKVLPELLGSLQLGITDVSGELSSLVKTFRLTNTNIIHTIPEWTLIAVVMLSVLDVKISALQEALQKLTSELFISTLMKEVHIQSEDLKNLRNIFKCHDDS